MDFMLKKNAKYSTLEENNVLLSFSTCFTPFLCLILEASAQNNLYITESGISVGHTRLRMIRNVWEKDMSNIKSIMKTS